MRARRFNSLSPYSAIDTSEIVIDSDGNARFGDVAELESGKILISYTVANGSIDGNGKGVAFKIYSSNMIEVVGRT